MERHHVIAALIAIASLLAFTDVSAQILCTADVKVCPDGSSVSRNPAKDCEFDECQSCINPITGDVDTLVLCLVDPCTLAECESDPSAECTPNFCGGCHALFSDDEGDPVDCTDVCSLPSDVGPCDAVFPRWFFDGDAGKCTEFIYGGCGGNANNFETKASCEEECPPVDVCELPTDPGPCRGSFRRWTFDAAIGECVEFTYGGCLGNDNNFQTQAACEERCEVPEPCRGDVATGDSDSDGVCDDIDICPLDPLDDADRDGVCDSGDLCPGTPPEVTIDESGCSGLQLVEGVCLHPSHHRNHGQYVRCVARESREARRAGLLTHAERTGLVRAAARK